MESYRLRHLTKPVVRKNKNLWIWECVMCQKRRANLDWEHAFLSAHLHSTTSSLHRQITRLRKQVGDR